MLSTNLIWSFTLGLAAFFSPCAAALLPSYVGYVLAKKQEGKSFTKSLVYGTIFGLKAVLGFFVLFGFFGALVLAIGSQIKAAIPWISIITGIFLVVVGVMMFLGKKFLLPLPQVQNEKGGAFIFGIAYGVAALGCVFPLFLTVVISGLSYGFMGGLFMILAYILGMSVLMVAVTTASAVASKALQRWMRKVIPVVVKITSVILVIAGIYMIWYQMQFFL